MENRKARTNANPNGVADDILESVVRVRADVAFLAKVVRQLRNEAIAAQISASRAASSSVPPATL